MVINTFKSCDTGVSIKVICFNEKKDYWSSSLIWIMLVAWICMTVDQTVVWGHKKLQKWNNRCINLTPTYFDFSFKHVSFPWVHKFFYINFDSLIWFHNNKVGISPIKTSFSAINVPELVIPVFFTKRSKLHR